MKIDSIEALHSYSKKLTLLYVENESQTRDDFKEIFKKLFDVVYVAKGATDGLEFFSQHKIDIVITCIEMQNINGLEMARIIRKQNLYIPIILIAAHMDMTSFHESIEIGVDAYLLAPLNETVLLNTLKRIVKNIKTDSNLYEDSQYFRALTEASIVSKADVSGIITYVNDNLCTISGYTREELIGKPHNILRHPDTPSSLFSEMWKTILSGAVWSGRVENLSKSGNSMLTDTIIIPLKDSKEKILEFIAIRQDITEFVHLKRKMKIDILKKEEQQRINEAKEAFLVLFTHELKTPLNAIINFSKYIQMKLTTSQYLEPVKTAQLLKSIVTNAYDMLSNVNNILDISKLQSNKLSYNKKLFSINKLLASLLEQFDSLIITKNITVQLLAEEEFEVYSDEYRTKQVISNILSNAIKYGKSKINIEIKEFNHGVELYIEDDGKGIVDKESVFNLYEQGNSSLIKRETQGTGVGLYFVKLVCNDLEISFHIEDSKRLGGTCFTLMFTKNKNKKVHK